MEKIPAEFAAAIRTKSSLHLGLYHSLYEWFNRLYVRDKANLFTTQEFVDLKVIPELKELVQIYRPELVWSDGEWEGKFR
jgi:alpha-L-fucosidase